MPARMDLDVNKIIQLYESGLSSVQIGKFMGISKPTVLRRLKENGTLRRKSCFERQADFNDHAFSVQTPNSCYWAGFIAADGCISNGTLLIELSIIDENHLIKFCKFLERSDSLWYRKRGNGSCVVGIRSTNIVADLSCNFNINHENL
jgi:hypothetical protein